MPIMPPPVKNGGIESSSACWPHRMPTPVGPSILCDENAMKSAPQSCTSTGMRGTAWHASTTLTAPAARAGGKSLRRVDRAQRIADGREREDLGAVEQRVEVGQIKQSVVGDPHETQLRPRLLREHLPRHEIGVVLHLRHH